MTGAREIRERPLHAWTGAPPRLGRGDIHVILVRMPPLRAAPRMLDATERGRMRRLAFARDRQRFAWSHAVLRTVLGCYLGRPAAAVRFAARRDLGMRPTLPPGARLRLGFSLSHAGDAAAVAVMRGAAIGVDVETARSRLDALAVARRHFAASETAEIAASSDRGRIFLDFWTAKEAVLKALGTGLSRPLSDIVLGFDDRGRLRLRGILGAGLASRRLAVRSLRPECSIALSLSIAGPAWARSVTFWTGDAAAIVRPARGAPPLSGG